MTAARSSRLHQPTLMCIFPTSLLSYLFVNLIIYLPLKE